MIEYKKLGSLNIESINLWAHVGVLEQERLHGQAFLLDITIWHDLDNAAIEDNLLKSVDYSFAIKYIQELALDINCMTIEHFSEQILNCLEKLYGSVPMKIHLKKCSPPVSGFSGIVSVGRTRNLS